MPNATQKRQIGKYNWGLYCTNCKEFFAIAVRDNAPSEPIEFISGRRTTFCVAALPSSATETGFRDRFAVPDGSNETQTSNSPWRSLEIMKSTASCIVPNERILFCPFHSSPRLVNPKRRQSRRRKSAALFTQALRAQHRARNAQRIDARRTTRRSRLTIGVAQVHFAICDDVKALRDLAGVIIDPRAGDFTPLL